MVENRKKHKGLQKKKNVCAVVKVQFPAQARQFSHTEPALTSPSQLNALLT